MAERSTRLFFVKEFAQPVEDVLPTLGSVTYLELPRIPVTADSPSDRHDTQPALVVAARPSVSPAVMLGRQSPFLSNAVRNDRTWSRAFLEITTWCIEGLSSSTHTVAPIDAAIEPQAGLRIRLCGRGPQVRVLPGNPAREDGIVTLSQKGSWAWLQHGDIVEMGSLVQLRFLALHLRVASASLLADNVSYVWVPSHRGELTETAKSSPKCLSTVPTALLCRSLSIWSALSKVLRSKILLEAGTLTRLALEAESQCRRGSRTRTLAPERIHRTGEQEDEAKPSEVGISFAVAPSEDSRVYQDEELVVVQSYGITDKDQLSSTSAAMELEEADAATPAAESQPQQHRSPPPLISRIGHSMPTSPRRRARQGEGAMHRTATPRRSSVPNPLGGSPSRYSLATFSETADDRLNEALLNLERGGHIVGETLMQRHEEALLLGVLDDDLSGTREASLLEGTSGSSPQRRSALGERVASDDSSTAMTRVRGRCVTKRGRDKPTAGRKRRSSRSGSRGEPRSSIEEAHHSGGSLCGNTTTKSQISPSPSLHAGAVRAHKPCLTRADIRENVRPPLQEDSQVIFFDHS